MEDQLQRGGKIKAPDGYPGVHQHHMVDIENKHDQPMHFETCQTRSFGSNPESRTEGHRLKVCQLTFYEKQGQMLC